MELIEEYRQISKTRKKIVLRDTIESTPHLLNESIWQSFHMSDDHMISVFAGRRAGKTYNLALRAVMSQHDCLIFTTNKNNAEIIKNYIYEFTDSMILPSSIRQTYESREGISKSFRIGFENERRIDIIVLRNNVQSFRGIRLYMKEVMFDEFENDFFENFIKAMRPEIGRATNIVCVGSMITPYDSPSKRWFKESQTKLFIDNQLSDHIDSFHTRHEMVPSELSQMIDHLPPFDYYF